MYLKNNISQNKIIDIDIGDKKEESSKDFSKEKNHKISEKTREKSTSESNEIRDSQSKNNKKIEYKKALDPNLLLKTEIISSYICPLCKGLLDKATIDLCGCNTVFCKECLEKYLTENNHRCPASNKISIKEPQFIPAIDMHISSLKMKCKNFYKGCEFKGTIEKFREHIINECGKELIKCHNKGCEEMIMREKINQHSKECLYRYVNCNFCNLKIKFFELQKHFKQCKEKLKIDLKCGENETKAKSADPFDFEGDNNINSENEKNKEQVIKFLLKRVCNLENKIDFIFNFLKSNWVIFNKMDINSNNNDSINMNKYNEEIENNYNLRRKGKSEANVNCQKFLEKKKSFKNKNNFIFHRNKIWKKEYKNLLNLIEKTENPDILKENKNKIISLEEEEDDDEEIEEYMDLRNSADIDKDKETIEKSSNNDKFKEEKINNSDEKNDFSFLNKKTNPSRENIDDALLIDSEKITKNKEEEFKEEIHYFNDKNIDSNYFKIEKNIISAFNLEKNKHYFVFLNEKFRIKKNEEGIFKISFILLKDIPWLGVGFCDKVKVEENNYRFENKMKNNGFYILSVNSVSWNSNNKLQFRKKIVSIDPKFLSKKGTVIECVFIPNKGLLDFYVENKLIIQLTKLKVFKDEYFTPCVVFFKEGSVEVNIDYPEINNNS